MKKKLLSLAVASLVCGSVAEARFYVGVEGGYTSASGILDPLKFGESNKINFNTIPASEIKNAFKSMKRNVQNGVLEVDPYKGYSIGVNFGSEHLFLRDYLGFRWGASVGYSNMSGKYISVDNSGDIGAKIEGKYSFLDTGLSLDLMTNFYSSQSFAIGIFGGAELDYHYMLTGKYEHKIWDEEGDMKNQVPSRHSLDLSGRVGITTLIASHHRIDLTAKLPIGSITAGKASNIKLGEPLVRITFSAGYKFVF
ncbi:outer membrane beta-barrel protein [Helicobacter brantae]|uniref:Outer membrane beta-barrel protein n=1 Tax=Helicobacter brantae TaxID=375927 RepID=A0A3D8J2R4_9HELI|nr:outer membrane beta-barrel protein [Helicobacter brantae]RDU71435.1 hypothetical protein CQA58_02490 [Helicobacter brantae]